MFRVTLLIMPVYLRFWKYTFANVLMLTHVNINHTCFVDQFSKRVPQTFVLVASRPFSKVLGDSGHRFWTSSFYQRAPAALFHSNAHCFQALSAINHVLKFLINQNGFIVLRFWMTQSSSIVKKMGNRRLCPHLGSTLLSGPQSNAVCTPKDTIL